MAVGSFQEAGMAKRERKTYSDAQRKQILAAALGDKLTAEQVQKKFGVKPVTYYSWRKKAGIKGPRGRKPAAFRAAVGAAAGGSLGAQVRAGVQAKVREILPAIVREEVSSYLDMLFGASGGRRGRRNRK
jgi:transposase-like protein